MNWNQRGINSALVFFLVLLLGSLGAGAASAQAPEGKLPVAITSSGQSPDGFILKMLCDRIKLKVAYNSLIKSDELKDFKSLMVVMGGSAKGLGAAGIDEPGELQRMQVAPRCDYLIVTEDGNKDGYFTTLAKEKQIPLTVVKDTQELGALLKKTFGAN
jgi:hypothetical protein